MPFAGDTFVRLYNWQSDQAALIPATASRFDGEDDGFATGLSQVKALTTTNTNWQTAFSIAFSTGTTGLAVSGSPITTNGTFTLSGTLVVANGGTGSGTAAGARTNLVAAASGANSDITSLITSTALVESGTIASTTLGFRGIPQNQQAGSYTLVLTDAGKSIRLTSAGAVIPANASVAFPIGTTIMIINRTGAGQTISITTDSLVLAGTGTTGTRTIADTGMATIYKDTSTVWLITGTGIS